MNRQEWLKLPGNRATHEYKYVQQLLKQWKKANGITERCDVHHRDDTEECIKYNEEHYELFGLNEDGTFEEGKYVIFMTIADHTHHHKTGKTYSLETRAKQSAARMGHVVSDETRAKQSAAMTGENNPAKRPEVRTKHSAAIMGDNNPMKRPEVREKIMGNNSPTKRPEVREKLSKNNCSRGMSILYNVYKENGGQLKWQVFKHALKTGDITFTMQPISVFINGGVK